MTHTAEHGSLRNSLPNAPHTKAPKTPQDGQTPSGGKERHQKAERAPERPTARAKGIKSGNQGTRSKDAGRSFGSHHGNNSTTDPLRSPYTRAAREERDTVRATLSAALSACGLTNQAKAVHLCECREWLTDSVPGPGKGALILKPDGPQPDAWKPVQRGMYCDHRLCPWCQRGRSSRYLTQLEPAVREHFKAKPAMATFTQDDRPDESLSSAAKRMLGYYAKLTRRKAWRQTVRGGLRSIEVTRNVERRSWHVHLHVLIDTDYFPQADLLALWRECMTGDRDGWLKETGKEPRQIGGVNIKRLDDISEAVKYVVKGIEALTTWPAETLQELLAWMKGRRLLQTFGSLFGLAISEDEEEHTEEPSEEAGVNAVTGEVRTADDCQWSNTPAVEDAAWTRQTLVHQATHRRKPWDSG